MSARVGVAIMAATLALYLAVLGWRAVEFLATGNAVAVAIGVALLLFPILGAWALGWELIFGIRANRLADRLAASSPGTPEGEAPMLSLPPDALRSDIRAAALATFPDMAAEVEADPTSWQARLRLSECYDAAGDRRRARRVAREAITLARTHDPGALRRGGVCPSE